jgi:hypothetical protein
VECSLKAVLLHDHAWDAAQGRHDSQKLHTHHRTLRHSFGHNLVTLANHQIGPVGAKYFPDFRYVASARVEGAPVLEWKETVRYAAEDPDVVKAAQRASTYLLWAEYVHKHTIVEMRLDGVL